jgi:hypothetical protein
MLDFTLNPIHYLEETTGPSIEVMIKNFKFSIPASWNILVVDRDTSLIDTIPVSNCTSNNYEAFIMTTIGNRFESAQINVLDLIPEQKIVHPMIQKGTMFCHPIGTQERNEESVMSVMIGPFDLYQKYLEGVSAKELLY